MEWSPNRDAERHEIHDAAITISDSTRIRRNTAGADSAGDAQGARNP